MSGGPSKRLSDETVLARRYRALLRAYPKAWRAERGDELLGTLLDAAEPGRQRPSLRESASILTQGTRERFGPRRRAPGEVWSEALRIGALVLLGQTVASTLLFMLEFLDVPGSPAAELTRYGAGVAFGIAAMVALVLGQTVVTTALTGLWIAAPVMHGEMPWQLVTAFLILAGLSLADRTPSRRRTSAVWLVVAPLVLLLGFGFNQMTGGYFSSASTLLYPFALLLAFTAGVTVDPRLPIAVACLTVAMMLNVTLHVPSLFGGATIEGLSPMELRPQTAVFGAIAVVLLTIGHLRARRLARI
ncbi:hypothetical protein ACFO1B_37775 [Dactylosporangium siamense]|uniref:Uncharacterized protein n=1 Tax=Dactylosporangium siamense TaxID=685454 RepID=A0A919PSQ3_9ACTN|nr:hypothetical protein [Dactylosporangium siamense]GIG49522.1 hypothetical protein Dsi01nite_075630 [Dactylosporangium siamense]